MEGCVCREEKDGGEGRPDQFEAPFSIEPALIASGRVSV